jgi:hypothetical protein
MPKPNIPTYAIVELLMRLAQHDESIGDYKNHSIYDEGVIVKTTSGTIHFPETLIMQQFAEPEQVTDHELIFVASSFRPSR